MAENSHVILTISSEKGLADRHRMPIGQVISVLSEVRQMLVEAGKDVRREHGADPSTLSLGLELLADSKRYAVSKEFKVSHYQTMIFDE